MFEKIAVIIFPLLFLFGFLSRNIIVKSRIGNRIRAKDRLVSLAVLLMNAAFFLTIFAVYSERFYRYLGVVSFLRNPVISYVGYFIFLLALILGCITSAQMKDSWRIGVFGDQKTELIRNGLYACIRNPYFLSYYIVIFSLVLIRPCVALVLLAVSVFIVFHLMILKEEKVLEQHHGKEYLDYRNKTGRYLPRLKGKGPKVF